MEIPKALEILTEAEEFLRDKECSEFKEALKLAIEGLKTLLNDKT